MFFIFFYLIDEPIIKVSGFTLIWKPGTNKEVDEYTLFFEAIAELSPETDDIDLSLSHTLAGIFINFSFIKMLYFDLLCTGYSKILKFYLVLPDNLPPSHEVPFGHTRYKIEAYHNNQIISKWFSVNQWVELKKRNNAIVCIIFLLLLVISINCRNYYL